MLPASALSRSGLLTSKTLFEPRSRRFCRQTSTGQTVERGCRKCNVVGFEAERGGRGAPRWDPTPGQIGLSATLCPSSSLGPSRAASRLPENLGWQPQLLHLGCRPASDPKDDVRSPTRTTITMAEKRRASNPNPGSQLVKRPNLGSSAAAARASASGSNALIQTVRVSRDFPSA